MRIKRKDLKLKTEYWVCDTGMACGKTTDNVFKYNPTYFDEVQGKNILIFDSYYVAFTNEQEALNLSEEMRKDHNAMYEYND